MQVMIWNIVPEDFLTCTVGSEMGHEIVEYRKRHAIIHDLDFWAIRHFLLVSAEEAKQSELATFIRGWDWIGPGVYLGVEYDTFFNGEERLEQQFLRLLVMARKRLEAFGEFVPIEYIESNINLQKAYFTEAQPVVHWLEQLDKLSDLFPNK
ncbi:MAG TPA: hypothetical protein VMG59_12790 [Phycisphaerae bacterium]|nr:hypothetical protein [Phycisphaerae bacterium]